MVFLANISKTNLFSRSLVTLTRFPPSAWQTCSAFFQFFLSWKNLYTLEPNWNHPFGRANQKVTKIKGKKCSPRRDASMRQVPVAQKLNSTSGVSKGGAPPYFWTSQKKFFLRPPPLSEGLLLPLSTFHRFNNYQCKWIRIMETSCTIHWTEVYLDG